jgi:multiple sugar transport system permease protein
MTETAITPSTRGISTQARPVARYLHFARQAVLYAVLVISGLFMIVPFLWMLSTSLKVDQYVLTMPPQFIPRPLTLDSYVRLAELFPIERMFLNSTLVATLTTVGQLATCSMAAYAFARMRFTGSNSLFLVYLATLMVPSQVTITPLFILMRYLGWINTYQGLILPGVFSAFGTFLLRQFFLTIPRELEEAAFMDGASRWTVYRRIILPVAKPALATLGVFSFMESWNAFLWPLFVVRDVELMTLPVGLAALHGRWLTQWNLVMAGTVITVVPMLAAYLLAQQYFVRGVVLSGIKG